MHHICVFRSGSLSLDNAIEFQACFFLSLSFSSPISTFPPFIYVVQRLQTCTTTIFLPLSTLIFLWMMPLAWNSGYSVIARSGIETGHPDSPEGTLPGEVMEMAAVKDHPSGTQQL